MATLPIYPYDTEQWAALRDLIQHLLDIENVAEQCLQRGWPVPPPGLAADLQLGIRSASASVSLHVVLLREDGTPFPARLILERIQPGGTGDCYADERMGPVHADSSWAGALWAARRLAGQKECFPPAPDADVRWSIVLTDEDKVDLPSSKKRLTGNDVLIGRSAGAAFFLGFYYLQRTATIARGPHAERERRSFEQLLPLLLLPELPTEGETLKCLDDDSRARKLQLTAHWDNVIHIFPDHLPADAPDGSKLAGTLAELLHAARARFDQSCAPDNIPKFELDSVAACYIGGKTELARLRGQMLQPGFTVVHGPGGIGKTARVLRAVLELTSRGEFAHGRIWVNLYKGIKSGEPLPQYLHREIILTLKKESLPARVDQLESTARALLANQTILVLIEGAEVVPEAEVADLLGIFTSHSHVVWLTRRAEDAKLDCFFSGRSHEVKPLGMDDCVELIAWHAGLRNHMESAVPSVERPIWEAIARQAEFTPWFLRCAGRNIGWDREIPVFTSARELAADLSAEPLSLSSPGQRSEANARRFYEKALIRIRPLPDFPMLPDTARILFTALHAFHPAHGAPRDLWTLAAGVNNSQRASRNLGVEARRSLRSLGLTASTESGGTQPVHALAAAVSRTLWEELPLHTASAILDRLHNSVQEELARGLPTDWSTNSTWHYQIIALAQHFAGWTAMRGWIRSPYMPFTWGWFFEAIEARPCLELHVAVTSAIVAEARVTMAEGSSILDTESHQITLVRALLQFSKVAIRVYNFVAAEGGLRESLALLEKEMIYDPNSVNLRGLVIFASYHLSTVLKEQFRWEDAKEHSLRASQMLSEIPQSEVDRVFDGNAALSMSLLIPDLKDRPSHEERLPLYEAIGKLYEDRARRFPEDGGHRRRVADAWLSIGRAREGAIDWRGAHGAFYKALKEWRKLARDHPDEPDFLYGLSETWNCIGRVDHKKDDWLGARMAFDRALEIGEKLAASYPGVPDYQCELCNSLNGLGLTYIHRLDWLGARDAFNKAMEIYEKLAVHYPDVADFQTGLFVTWQLIGIVYKEEHNWESARAACQKPLENYQKLAVAHPEVPVFQRGLSHWWNFFGGLCQVQHQWQDAHRAFDQALEVRLKLASAYPNVPDFKRDLCESWKGIGTVCFMTQDWRGARAAYQRAVEIYQELTADQPGVPDFKEGLSNLLTYMGCVYEVEHDWQNARIAYHEALAIGQKLVLDYPDVQRVLSAAWKAIGGLCLAEQDWQGAHEACNRALEIAKAMVVDHPGEPAFLGYFADAHERVSRVHRKSGDWVSAFESVSEAQRIVKELRVSFPQMLDFVGDCMVIANCVAECALHLQDWTTSIGAVEDALGCAAELKIKRPASFFYREQLVVAWQRRGEIASAQGATGESMAAWRQALDSAAALAAEHGGTPGHLALHAEVCLGLARAGEQAKDEALARTAREQGRATMTALRNSLAGVGGTLTPEQQATAAALDNSPPPAAEGACENNR